MQQIKFKMDSHFRGNDGGWEAVKQVFWWRKLALAAIRKARINPPLVLTPHPNWTKLSQVKSTQENLMLTVNIHEAKTQLSRFIDQATLGESIIIARAGRPVARLMPLEAVKQTRQLGLGKAIYSLPADFDAMHTGEIQAMFEAE